MRNRVAAVVGICTLIAVMSTPLARADGYLGHTNGWQSSKASGSGGRITVEASKRSRGRGQAKRQVVRARGSGNSFAGVV